MKAVLNALCALGLLVFIAIKALIVTIVPSAVVGLVTWLFGASFITVFSAVWVTLAVIIFLVLVGIVVSSGT